MLSAHGLRHFETWSHEKACIGYSYFKQEESFGIWVDIEPFDVETARLSKN